MTDREEQGVTATVNEAGHGGYARGSFDRERQGRSTYLVGVLARALTTQVEELARAAPPAPDGWWFGEPDRPDRVDGAGTTDEREERR